MKRKRRPYFATSVSELDSLVRAKRGDFRTLRVIAREFRHRPTPSATRLQTRAARRQLHDLPGL